MISSQQNTVEQIVAELDQLAHHIKTYSCGAYSAFYLQLHTNLKLQDILNMRLYDIYRYDDGDIKVKKQFVFNGVSVDLDKEDRKELAWYAFTRIAVQNTKEQVLDDYLCVNKQNKQLNQQVYRKILDRSSYVLGLSRNYKPTYLRRLYGYLAIAYGRKTIDEVAREYDVERYYLLSRTFKNLQIQFAKQVLHSVAGVETSADADKVWEEAYENLQCD